MQLAFEKLFIICGYGGAGIAGRYCLKCCLGTDYLVWVFHVSCNPWKPAFSPCLIATQRHSLHMPNMAEVYFGKVVLLWRFLIFGSKGC